MGHVARIGKSKPEGNVLLKDHGVDMRHLLIWLVHKLKPFLFTTVCSMMV